MGTVLLSGGWIAWLTAASLPFQAQADSAAELVSELAPRPVKASFVDFGLRQNAAGTEIRRAEDGLFYINAMINGVPVRFLVDTGATMVVLTPGDAARLGVLPEPAAFNHGADTPGGRTAFARVRLDRMAAGPAERQGVEVAIASANIGTSLLGQSWLSGLRSVTIAGDVMVLQ